MKNLTVSIPHRLTRAEVKQRLQDEIAKLRREHGAMLHEVKENWTGDRLDFSASAMGQSLAGNLTVEDQAVRIEIELPWLVAMMAGKIKQQIEQRGTHLLSGPGKA